MRTKIKNFTIGSTYISNTAIAKLTLKKHIQMIIGGFFTMIFVYGLVAGLLGYKESLRDGTATYIVMLIPSVLLFINGLRNSIYIGLARRYDSIFMCDNDGTVTIDELSRQTGKPPFKIISELETLFKRGVFRDCTMQKQGKPCVILSGREDSKTSFTDVVCERCNGTTRLRTGTSGKCEYCGNWITSRKSN